MKVINDSRKEIKMKKYMNWTLLLLVGFGLFWATVAGLNLSEYAYWNVYDYSYSMKTMIDTVLMIGALGGLVMIVGLVFGSLPVLVTIDAVHKLKERRIKVRETKRKKWLM